MENIQKILGDIGITIPKEQEEQFNAAFLKNYRTIAETENLRSQIDDLKTQNNEYAESLKQLQENNDDVDSLKAKITELQTNYDNAQKEYEAKLSKQQYESLVREKTSGIKFTSNSAKRAFENDLFNNPLTVKDGAILGFDDFLNKYKQEDGGAFVQEDKADMPRFTAPKTAEPPQHKTVNKMPLIL